MVQPNELLADHEAHADPLAVHLGRSLQLAKFSEQALDFLRFYPLSCVNDMNCEEVVHVIETCKNANLATSSELNGILEQVDHDLLQSKVVTIELLRQGLIDAFVNVEFT